LICSGLVGETAVLVACCAFFVHPVHM
jgi:hypothetical protein